MSRLKATLDALLDQHDRTRSIQRDPIRLPHRYVAPQDRALAALFAATYAYGRVDLFLERLDRIAEVWDAHGGPSAFVRHSDPQTWRGLLGHLHYRWTRGDDLVLFHAALRGALAEHCELAAVFAGATVRDALQHASEQISHHASQWTAPLGLPSELTRGLRYFLPSPRGGSACKRSNLFLRWMVRPDDGVDLGLWTHLRPDQLIIPVDRHIQRITPLIGLVPRADGSWRSAVAITDALRALDPDDPVRYDFALAHLGISDGCRASLVPPVCSPCPVRSLCQHGRNLPSETA